MSKIDSIQKDVILFFILLAFFVCFFFWWNQPKEGFDNNIRIAMIQPVPGLRVPSSWTNSVLNGRRILSTWSEIQFDTNEPVAKPSKNSEFSLTFWLFLGNRRNVTKPIFRIRDSPYRNSPGVWLTNDNIQIRNDTSSKTYKTTRIPHQTLDFYAIVFTETNYSIYINGELRTTEKWDNKPEPIQNAGAYIEIATAATENHYVVKDMKLYNEVFIPDTVSELYNLTNPTIGAEIDRVIETIGGLPVMNASDWTFAPSLNQYYEIKDSHLVGNWSTTNINNSGIMTISFWINITELNSNWRSIFHVTNQPNTNCCSVGNRVPAMWIYPGSTNVHFRHSTPSQGNDGPYIDAYQVPMNTPTFITIVSNSTTIAFYVNGVQIGSTHTFSAPLVPADSTASFYMADPWHAVGGFQLKNFKLYNNVFGADDVFNLYSTEGVVMN